MGLVDGSECRYVPALATGALGVHLLRQSHRQRPAAGGAAAQPQVFTAAVAGVSPAAINGVSQPPTAATVGAIAPAPVLMYCLSRFDNDCDRTPDNMFAV